MSAGVLAALAALLIDHPRVFSLFSPLQDEVAHTLTESRVLKNTRHPFLTVSVGVKRFNESADNRCVTKNKVILK